MKAMALFVLALLELQTPTPPEMPATIEGEVILYGTTEAIPKVQITLVSAANAATRTSTITDAWGHYELKDVAAGVYYLSAQRAGFSTPIRKGVPVPVGSQRTVAVAPQQHLDHADLSLVRGGVMTGRVLNGNGKPIPGLRVEARSVSTGGKIADFASRTVETNDRGEFRLFDLEAGQYIVSAEYRQLGASTVEPQASWVKTFFPGVVAIARSSAVDVGEDSVVTVTDFAMQSPMKFTISGVVTVPRADLTGLSLSGIYLVPSDEGPTSRESRIPANAENVSPQRALAGNMRFEIRSVPGNYELFVQVLDRRSRSGFAGRVVVQVNQQDVKDLVVDTSGATVTGKVLVTGRAPGPAGSLGVRLLPVDLPSTLLLGINPAVLDPNGNFTVLNIPNGKWRLVATNIPNDLTIADIRQGSVSIPQDGIRAADKVAEPIQIVLSPSGSIDGVVRDADQNPIAAIRVVEYPYNQPPAAETHQATTDAAGHFVLTGLAPGEHLLFAVPSEFLTGFATTAFASSAEDIKPVVTPYPSQGVIAKVGSGSSTSVTLTPLKTNTSPQR